MQSQKETTAKQDNRAAKISLSIMERLFSSYHPCNFSVKLWDGTEWRAEKQGDYKFTLVLNHPGSLKSMFWPPNELSLAEAYIFGDFDIEGDIESVFSLGNHLETLLDNKTKLLTCLVDVLKLPSYQKPLRGRSSAKLSGSKHSKNRDRQAVTYHYDVPNNFYKLWLDNRMVYSCAYFENPAECIHKAQERKLDYICRKLRLKPGEKLLDIGCGWGGLIIHAAKNYGVEATGITLSQQQVELANSRAKKEEISDRCRAVVKDYREITRPESYDKLVSVGMFEHVGKAKMKEYFKQAYRILKPGGVFLNHGIGKRKDIKKRRGPTFVQHYVFPDGELLPISETIHVAEKAGFEVRDVENLREHYMHTLRKWVKRLKLQKKNAINETDEVTYRIWLLFMSGSAYGFKVGNLNLFQTLLSKPDNYGRSGLPLTRDDWYDDRYEK